MAAYDTQAEVSDAALALKTVGMSTPTHTHTMFANSLHAVFPFSSHILIKLRNEGCI